MHSTQNKCKSVITKRFIKTVKTEIYEKIAENLLMLIIMLWLKNWEKS